MQKVVNGGATAVYVYDAFEVLAAEYPSGTAVTKPCTNRYLSMDQVGATVAFVDATRPRAVGAMAINIAACLQQPWCDFGPLDLSLSPVTVAELVHGICRSKISEAGQRRRRYIEELVSLVPVHPVTNRTGWLVGQIEGQGCRDIPNAD